MYLVTKRIEVAGAHSLSLPYRSKCCNPHGHNWIIEVTVECAELDSAGMVLDFSAIKEIVNQLDHADVNQVVKGTNPTAENIARWIHDRILDHFHPEERTHRRIEVVMVQVQESEGNTACYIP